MDYDDCSYGCSSYGDDNYSFDDASYEGYEGYAEDEYENGDFDSTASELDDDYLNNQNSLSSHISSPFTPSQSHIETTYNYGHDYDSDDTEILISNHEVSKSPKRDNNHSLQHNHGVVTKKSPFFDVIRKKTVKDISSAKSSFHYAIQELLRYDLDEPIPVSLVEHFGNEIDMIKILSMYEEDIDHLTYHVSPSIVKDLHKSHKKAIKTLLGFAEFRYNEGKPIFEDWSNVTRSDFRNFQYFVYRRNPTILPSNLI